MPGLIKFGQVRNGHPVIGRWALEECPQRRVFRAPGGQSWGVTTSNCPNLINPGMNNQSSQQIYSSSYEFSAPSVRPYDRVPRALTGLFPNAPIVLAGGGQGSDCPTTYSRQVSSVLSAAVRAPTSHALSPLVTQTPDSYTITSGD